MAGAILLGKHCVVINFEYVQDDLESSRLVGVSLTCADTKITFELHDNDDNLHVYHSSVNAVGSDLIEVIQPEELEA